MNTVQLTDGAKSVKYYLRQPFTEQYKAVTVGEFMTALTLLSTADKRYTESERIKRLEFYVDDYLEAYIECAAR